MPRFKIDRRAMRGLTPLNFLKEVPARNEMIEKASDEWPEIKSNVNRLAESLHPHFQFAKITEVKEYPHAKAFTMVADTQKGTKSLAYFRAGQYVSMELTYDEDMRSNKPYCIMSGPESCLDKKNSSYTFLVKQGQVDGASDYILKNWQVGTQVTMSGPLGHFYYQSLRDQGKVLAIAGGSGITPFFSMASAIVAGIEDFELTILYGSRTRESILLKNELDELCAKSNGKVKVAYVLSDEMCEGFEHGFINNRLIEEYASGVHSVFVCGPRAMYHYLESELSETSIPEAFIHFECAGDYGDPKNDFLYPSENIHKVYELKVLIRGREQIVQAPACQSLLISMEWAGIRVPSDCRSGQCGWCHSRLISGDVYIPGENDGRREADAKFGWIHPCSTFPLSDLSIEIFPLPEI